MTQRSDPTSSARPAHVHLAVICHGLWGEPAHTAYLAKSLCDAFDGHLSPASALSPTASEPHRGVAGAAADTLEGAVGDGQQVTDSDDESEQEAHAVEAPRSPAQGRAGASEDPDEVRLVVLNTRSNSSVHTYDGIDWGAERVVNEIYAEVRRLRDEEGARVTRFSITGYSLGGLVARYAIGLLWADGFFSSPDDDVPSRSQVPTPLRSSSPAPASGAAGRAEKVIQGGVKPVNFTTFATPHVGVPRAASFFGRLAGLIGPRLLSRTGEQLYGRDVGKKGRSEGGYHKGRSVLECMTRDEYPFLRALKAFERVTIIANAINDLTVPYVTGAIDAVDRFAPPRPIVTLDPTYEYVLHSWSPAPHPPPLPLHRRIRRAILPRSVPFFLNPRMNPWRFPFNYLAVVLFPLAIPAFLILIIVRFQSQSKESRKRIGGLQEAWEKENANAVEGAQDGVHGRIERLLIRAQVEASRAVDELMEGANAGAEAERAGAGSMRAVSGWASTPADSPGEDEDKGEDGNVQQRQSKDTSSPLLSPQQVAMIETLNAIPQLKKTLAWFDDVTISHAMLICRTPSTELHRRGESVVRKWTDDFLL